jgi:hypothetical protein
MAQLCAAWYMANRISNQPVQLPMTKHLQTWCVPQMIAVQGLDKLVTRVESSGIPLSS